MTVPNKQVLVLGISGATCSGKTTIARELSKILPDCKIFCQDDYYFPVDDPRHVWLPQLNHINFDILSSLDNDRLVRDIKEHMCKELSKIPTETTTVNGRQVVCYPNDKFKNLFWIKQSQCHVVIVEGFCIFNFKPLAELCNLKYYFTLTFEECFRRRIKRVYDPPDCPGYFEQCAWPEHLKQVAEVQKNVENVVFYDSNSTNHSEQILRDIVKVLK